MAFRTWAKLLGSTLGVAALAGASQLGLAYGLGILRLTRVVELAARDQWTAQLAWVAWFAMSAAVLGGLAGGRLRDRWRAPSTPGTFVGLALAAGLGAALVVPLTMQPARTARVDGVHPVFVIGICAALGAAVGVFAAYAALTQLIARRSLSVIGIAIWVLALLSVAPSLAPDDPLPAVRLGVLDAGYLSPGLTQRAALFTMPALALVAGAILGYAARRRELPLLTIALAGLPGPALLTLSYLIAGPGAGADRYQVVPYWAAMTATGAGVLGSVLAAVIRRTPDDADDLDPDPGRRPEEREPADRGRGDDEPTAALGLGRHSGADDDEPTAALGLGRQSGPDAGEPTAPIHPRPRRAEGEIPDQPRPVDGPRPADAPPRPARRGRAPRKAAPPPEPTERSAPDGPRHSEDSPTGELPAFDAFAGATSGPKRGRRGASSRSAQPGGAAPALPEVPPQAPRPQRRPVNMDATPGRLTGAPLVPEPEAISAPLAQPEPSSPPLSVVPAPEKKSKRQVKDDDYVDWVSKLSNE
jgi:hypothetical protein